MLGILACVFGAQINMRLQLLWAAAYEGYLPWIDPRLHSPLDESSQRLVTTGGCIAAICLLAWITCAVRMVRREFTYARLRAWPTVRVASSMPFGSGLWCWLLAGAHVFIGLLWLVCFVLGARQGRAFDDRIDFSSPFLLTHIVSGDFLSTSALVLSPFACAVFIPLLICIIVTHSQLSKRIRQGIRLVACEHCDACRDIWSHRIVIVGVLAHGASLCVGWPVVLYIYPQVQLSQASRDITPILFANALNAAPLTISASLLAPILFYSGCALCSFGLLSRSISLFVGYFFHTKRLPRNRRNRAALESIASR